jgi:hypothetical protein
MQVLFVNTGDDTLICTYSGGDPHRMYSYTGGESRVRTYIYPQEDNVHII